MPDRRALEHVLNSIDARAAVVILIDGAEVETAAKGIDNKEALFEICWSVALQIAGEIFADMPEEKRRGAKLVLPTLEDARRMGILRSRRNGLN
jgi:hypothetical protein